MLAQSMSRKSFLVGTAGVGAALGTSAAAFAQEAIEGTSSTQASLYPESDIPSRLSLSEFAAAAAECEPITAWDDEETYEVVVVGAGVAGVPAALKAYEDGATVCLLQKEATAIGQGTGPCFYNSELTTDPAGKAHLMHLFWEANSYRSDHALNMAWADNSEEALLWYIDVCVESGLVLDEDFDRNKNNEFVFDSGVAVTTMVNFSNVGGMYRPCNAICEKFAAELNIHYECPGVQLIKEGDAVVGVFARRDDGTLLRVNATKGVILATGDYQNNEAMVTKYCPDALPFSRKQFNKTGDGHLMGMMAGGCMSNIGHTKMIHRGMEATRKIYQSLPLLAVNFDGERFTAEDIDFEIRNNSVKSQPNHRWITVVDANIAEQAQAMGESKVYGPEDFAEFGEDDGMFSAETLAELADKLGIPADTLQATVDRYNELCELGYDADFGKSSQYLAPIAQAPFYAIVRQYMVAAITSGLYVDANCRVLDVNSEPIPGLFAVGNTSGEFFGGNDYPMAIAGMSVSRAITSGYIAGRVAAAL